MMSLMPESGPAPDSGCGGHQFRQGDDDGGEQPSHYGRPDAPRGRASPGRHMNLDDLEDRLAYLKELEQTARRELRNLQGRSA